jgi:hypothetical protein
MQVLVEGRALDGEGRVKVLDAVGLGEGLSEDLVGAFRAGDALSVIGPFCGAVFCVLLLHPAGSMVVRGPAVGWHLGSCFLDWAGSLRDHGWGDHLVKIVRHRGLGECLFQVHLVGRKYVGLFKLGIARSFLAGWSRHVRVQAL